MVEALKTQLGRMLKWQSRALVAIAVLLLVVVARWAAGEALEKSAAVGVLAGAVTLAALLTAAVLGAVTLWQIFEAGRLAFGFRSGFVYVLLAAPLLVFGLQSGLMYALLGVVLLSWAALFVIPHMVRLDAKRLLGVEPDSLSRRD